MDHAQAQATALADVLGRKEWLESPIDYIGWHSASGIAYRQEYILAWRRLGKLGGSAFGDAQVAGLDQELPAFRHGIACVDREIQQRTFQLPRIDGRQMQVFFESGFYVYAVAQGSPQ